MTLAKCSLLLCVFEELKLLRGKQALNQTSLLETAALNIHVYQITLYYENKTGLSLIAASTQGDDEVCIFPSSVWVERYILYF